MDSLTEEGRQYVDDVIAELKKSPDAPLYVVAAKLKEALNIAAVNGSIARTLKEKINAKA